MKPLLHHSCSAISTLKHEVKLVAEQLNSSTILTFYNGLESIEARMVLVSQTKDPIDNQLYILSGELHLLSLNMAIEVAKNETHAVEAMKCAEKLRLLSQDLYAMADPRKQRKRNFWKSFLAKMSWQ